MPHCQTQPNRFHSALPERFQKAQQIGTELLHTGSSQRARNPLAALAGSAHTRCLRRVCGVGSLGLPQGLQASKASIPPGTQLTKGKTGATSQVNETDCVSSARSTQARWLIMCTAPQEALLGGKSCSRLLEGKGDEASPGLADECDKVWEMTRLLGQAWLKKDPLSLSTLPQTPGEGT